jgi:hypothetical protein
MSKQEYERIIKTLEKAQTFLVKIETYISKLAPKIEKSTRRKQRKAA